MLFFEIYSRSICIFVKILVLHNTQSGGKKWVSQEHALCRSLKKLNISFRFVVFDGNPKTLNFSECFLEFSFDTVLIAGGDGTFRRVLQAMHFENRQEKIIFFPCGSANIFAKMHQIPPNLRYLKNPVEKKIGIGIWNNREVFLISAIFGKAAKLSLDAHTLGKRFFGFFSYILGSLLSLFFPLRKTVQTESQKISVNSLLIFTPDFSRSVFPRRFCLSSSELLLLFLKDRTLFGLFSIVGDLFLAQKNPHHAELWHRKSCSFRASFGNLFHLDGDIVPNSKEVEKHTFDFQENRFSLLIPSV